MLRYIVYKTENKGYIRVEEYKFKIKQYYVNIL